ncbi:MAG TPA: hypothetical protein VKE51_14850 [Vicinamibacterales bacterium]|nr:hypothetical protein [Vicinamibacterales bacterium]
MTALLDGSEGVPVLSIQGVRDAIERDDLAKEAILRPMFGDEWAQWRTFPNRDVRDGERGIFGTVARTRRTSVAQFFEWTAAVMPGLRRR